MEYKITLSNTITYKVVEFLSIIYNAQMKGEVVTPYHIARTTHSPYPHVHAFKERYKQLGILEEIHGGKYRYLRIKKEWMPYVENLLSFYYALKRRLNIMKHKNMLGGGYGKKA